MITLLTIVLGYIFGISIFATMIDIIIFDIPFTLKHKKSSFINAGSILGGSITSLFFHTIIIVASSYWIHSIGGSVFLYIIDMFLACLITRNFSVQKMFSFYCNKHHNNIHETITFGIIKDRENNLYIKNYKEILQLFDAYNKFSN